MTTTLSFMAGARIFNGTFTLTNPRTNGHSTLDISTQKADAKFAPGKRVIYLLTGPDNCADYKGFGFVYDDGIVVWRKYQGTKQEKLAKILWSMWTLRADSPYAKYGVTMIESCTCVFCNRKLTEPLSALCGVGPECGSMRGIDREILPKRLPISSR